MKPRYLDFLLPFSLPHLVLSELPGHVLLGPLQRILQVPGPGFGFFHSQLPTLLCLSQLVFQTATLKVQTSSTQDLIHAEKYILLG